MLWPVRPHRPAGRRLLLARTLHSSPSFHSRRWSPNYRSRGEAIAKTTAEPVNQAHFRRRMTFAEEQATVMVITDRIRHSIALSFLYAASRARTSGPRNEFRLL